MASPADRGIIVIHLVKVKGELRTAVFKENVNEIAEKLGIRGGVRVVETLGRVDYVVIYRASSIEQASNFATEVRRIEDVVDSETLIGIAI